MKQEKNIALCIILSLVTCGIYGLIWFVEMTNDVKEYAEDTELASGGMALLFTIITCGIYGIYWAYKMGQLMNQAQTKNNVPAADNSVLYLVLEIVGLGIVTYCLIQNDLNTITRTRNAR